MRASQRFLTTAIAALSLFVAACSGPAATATGPSAGVAAVADVSASTASATAAAGAVPATPSRNETTKAASPAEPTVAPTPASAAPTTSTAGTATPIGQPSSQSAVRYTVVSDGTQADFRVREQLVGRQLPSDAVGTTTAVTGSVVLGADGKVLPDQSKLVVDLTSLRSDSSRRDSFIQRNTLDTARYPTATFVLTEVKGLAAPLPTSGQQTFQLVGDLTIHGVTRPVTWNVTSQVSGGDVTGQATTELKFEDFGMTPPQAGPVLSVNDNVKLEVSFHLARSA